MNFDKKNGNVAFNEKSHTYYDITNPKKRFISVTTLIHKFEPPFDKDFWSAYKAVEKLCNPDLWRAAKKELLSARAVTDKFLESFDISTSDFNVVQQTILDGWQKENYISTQRGTKIHSDLEQSFYKQKTDISLQKYGIGGKFTCIEGDTNFDLENGLYPEYLVYYDSPDDKIHVAGQIDLLAKMGNRFSIIDWKGLPLDTPIPTITGWKTMGTLKVGDKVFDCDGLPCAVVHKSEVHHNPCYTIHFDDGVVITADAEHRWLVNKIPFNPEQHIVLTTKELAKKINDGEKFVIRTAKSLLLPGCGVNLIPPESTMEAVKLIKSTLRSSVEQRQQTLSLVNLFIQSQPLSIRNKALQKALTEIGRTLGWEISYSVSDTEELTKKVVSKLYRTITEVKPTETVPTQCIEVDSYSSTFLCTEHLIVTHNTNKQIKQSAYFNPATKKSEKLEYPLNDLDNCNYSVYNMQLSTYAWMIEQAHPDWQCCELRLVHFDHNNQMVSYQMEYLKSHVEKMLNFWKKQSVLEEHRNQRKHIDY